MVRGIGDGFGTALVVFGIICGLIGWGVIELLIWLFSFVTITIG
jgi:hypothetical protein